ncbi:hypothetical protein NDU88_004357 [Pleurodeles waltl]|uniref:Myb/SANT-like DNA-binding domain-containing protein n=1 Tax=Pleurodeles waltl TaxID=8319 RepID=A0AAV7T8W7_PLEWA|nr:hypothetical protein NDU88_004357 [Pleurodeles waltl]
MTMCAGGPGEDLHCKCCCDLGLEETMAAATGERAPAFTSEELEKLVDGDLPQYALLYGPPDQQVSAHQKVAIWRAIAKDVRTLGVHNRRGTHCRKRWEDIRRWSRKTAEAQLGMASQRRRGASRTLTPLMSRILAVAYPDLDGRMRTSQQTQGGRGEVASEHEGAASHMALEGHATDSEYTSGTEGEGSSTAGTRADVSGSDSSSEGSSLVVAATSVPPATTGTAATQRTSTTLPSAPQRLPRARSPRKEPRHGQPTPGKAPKDYQCPAREAKDTRDQNPYPGSGWKWGATWHTAKGGKGPQTTREGWEGQHARQVRQQASCPGGPHQPHPRCAGEHPEARYGSPGGPRKPTDRWAGRPRQPHVRWRVTSIPGPEPLHWTLISSTAELGPFTQAPLRWAPPSQAPLNRAPPSQAPLNRAPPSQALLNRAPPSQAPLHWALHLKHR